MKVEIVDADFEKGVCERAKELLKQGLKQGPLLGEPFGKFTIFVDEKPEKIFLSFSFDEPELAGKKIYIGGM